MLKPEPELSPAEIRARNIDDLVDAWWVDHFILAANPPTTEQLRSAKEALKVLIAAQL